MSKNKSSEAFRQAAVEVAGERLTNTFFEKIDIFVQELLKWSRIHNLTAADSAEDILFKHVLDSLYFFRCADASRIKFAGRKMIDIGSGAGFPGLVLAMADKDLHIYLLESRKKRAAFLKYISALLELENVRVLNERLEDIKEKIHKGCEETFNIGTSRASMKPEALLKLAPDVIDKGGYLFIWSTASQAEKMLDKKSQESSWKISLCMYDSQFLRVPEIINDYYSLSKNTIIIAKNSGGK
jgi:16S rRNA (guanine527-N7)-methyltransferase